ncbi:phage tail protein [Vibrio parahaemolyticus]|nr:phage tail protein [Vibrio parahaemolyticus]HAS7012700.1 phage tail protein [Vibrio parahaemolyticus]
MSDFTAIGQLVTKGQELLDAIKGGAIRTMENAFDAFMANVNSQWAAKKSQVDNEALAAIGRVNTETVISDLGFTAYNWNGDFMDVVQLAPNKNGTTNSYPLGLGVVGDFNDGVKAEILPCISGGNPALRDPAVRDLLDYMGIGADTQYFSGSFNVLKLTVVDPALVGSGRLSLPTSHIKQSPSTTYMNYIRTVGDVSFKYWGGNTGGAWNRFYRHFKSNNPGTYLNVDMYLINANAGDVVYLALPMMCAGKFPETVKHGSLVNTRMLLERKINKNHPA